MLSGPSEIFSNKPSVSVLASLPLPFKLQVAPAPNPSGGIHKGISFTSYPPLRVFWYDLFPFYIYLSTLCSCSFWHYFSSLCSLTMESWFLFLLVLVSCESFLREGTGKEISFTGILRLNSTFVKSSFLAIINSYLLPLLTTILPCLYFCSFMFYIYCESHRFLCL